MSLPTSSVRVRLLVFALVGGLAVVVAGVRYADLLSVLRPSSYSVTAQMPRSGGIFERAEVTYRGVSVGRVRDVDFRRDGVEVTLSIEDEWQIPSTLTAQVHNRSAVGEQYLDLVPQRDGAPYLEDGDVIEAADTSTPVRTEELLVALDRFVDSVPKQALRTTVRELSSAMSGSGDDLRALLTNSRVILREARRALPATRRLLRTGGTVLQTQADQAEVISSALRSLDDLTEVVADHDGDVRTILRDAVGAAQALRLLAMSLKPVLPPMLSHLGVVSRIPSERLGALEESLVAIPYALASAITPGRGERAHFAFQGTSDPAVCERGYVPPRKWRSPHDLSFAPMDDSTTCTERGDTLPRGSNSVLDRDPDARQAR